jgi:hypothetical protein
MPEVSHVHKLMNHPQRDLVHPQWRQAFILEREGAAQAFSVSVRLKDGRGADGFPVSLYLRHKWMDAGAKAERLIWLFSNGAIYIEGRHLKRGLDALEEGKLKRIQEQDTNEIALIERHNADIRERDEKEPVVSKVIVSPGVDAVLESDESLAEIVKAIKGEL